MLCVLKTLVLEPKHFCFRILVPMSIKMLRINEKCKPSVRPVVRRPSSSSVVRSVVVVVLCPVLRPSVVRPVVVVVLCPSVPSVRRRRPSSSSVVVVRRRRPSSVRRRQNYNYNFCRDHNNKQRLRSVKRLKLTPKLDSVQIQ